MVVHSLPLLFFRHSNAWQPHLFTVFKQIYNCLCYFLLSSRSIVYRQIDSCLFFNSRSTFFSQIDSFNSCSSDKSTASFVLSASIHTVHLQTDQQFNSRRIVFRQIYSCLLLNSRSTVFTQNDSFLCSFSFSSPSIVFRQIYKFLCSFRFNPRSTRNVPKLWIWRS